jgi:murein DD-endopeptidase MepM/ murein hydrolase activator NlpD
MQGGCGIGLVINHGDYETVYCHTSKVLVSKGDRIKRGQRIGHVGSTGRSTGPHLHFEIRKGNKSYNPLNFLG